MKSDKSGRRPSRRRLVLPASSVLDAGSTWQKKQNMTEKRSVSSRRELRRKTGERDLRNAIGWARQELILCTEMQNEEREKFNPKEKE
jgi:hypothetical protein